MDVLRSPWLWVMVAGALGVRLVLAFAGYGSEVDIGAMAAVDRALADDPLRFYAEVNDPGAGLVGIRQWPYPPGFLPWIEVAGVAATRLGLPFHGTIHIPAILADVGIAVAVAAHLGWRGASQRLSLVAAALVLLGPSFLAISGYHGQIDSVAILPGVLAVVAWERLEPSRRALVAGVLIGAGAAIKWVPLLLVLALLPSARSAREAAVLIGAPAAVLALVLAPFAVADPAGVRDAAGYTGVPGLGGLTLLAQPALADAWLEGRPTELNSTALFLLEHPSAVMLPVAAALGAFLLRFRPAPADAAALLWLAIFAAVPSFVLQYAVWGLPFFLLAGFVVEVALIELLLLVPSALVYGVVSLGDREAELYAPIMIVVWGVWIVAVAAVGARMVRRRRVYPTGVQPPLVDPRGPRRFADA